MHAVQVWEYKLWFEAKGGGGGGGRGVIWEERETEQDEHDEEAGTHFSPCNLITVYPGKYWQLSCGSY